MKPGVTAAIVIGILVLIAAIVVPIVLSTSSKQEHHVDTIVFGVSPHDILVSTDGAKTTIAPTKPPFANSYIYSIIYNGSQFFAVNGNSLSTSVDGMTWSTPTSFANQLSMIFLGSAGPGKRLLAGGTNGPAGDSVILYSDDNGLTWSENRLVGGSKNFVDLTYAGKGTWWAFNGNIFKSTDNGLTWSTIKTHSSDEKLYYKKVIVHKSQCFALSQYPSTVFSPGRIFMSSDGGVKWSSTYEYANSSQDTIDDMVTNNSVILCITKQLRILISKDNGKNWTPLTPFNVSFKVDSTFITWTGSQFIVLLKTFTYSIPTHTQVYTSKDGYTWTSAVSSSQVFAAVAEK